MSESKSKLHSVRASISYSNFCTIHTYIKKIYSLHSYNSINWTSLH